METSSLKPEEKWVELTFAQQQGILQAMESIKNGKGIEHAVVMEKYRQKFILRIFDTRQNPDNLVFNL